MQNFVLFHAIQSEVGLSEEFVVKQNNSAPIKLHANCIIVISNHTYVEYNFFAQF